MYLTEEFFYCACELKHLDWAAFFLKVVRNQFPKSVKSMRMLAIFHECGNETVKAKKIYEDMIDSIPEDKQTIKRLVCYYRDQEMYGLAIKLLN